MTTATAGASGGSPSTRHWSRPYTDWLTPGPVLLVIIVGGLLLAWLLREQLTAYGPASVQPDRVLLPIGSQGSPLGTDGFGRDLTSRLLAGVPSSLIFGVAPATAAMALGIVVGLVSGYIGGLVDRIIARLIDILLAFPFILMAILIVAILGPALQNAMIAVTLAILPKNARLIRAETLSWREREFVVAARLAGVGHVSIMARHILPNVLPTALIVASIDVGYVITLTAGLSFLGLGVQPPDVDWGTLIADGSRYVTSAPHLAFLPSLLVGSVGLAFVLLGDDLRRRLGRRE